MGNYRPVSLTLLPGKNVEQILMEAMKDRKVIEKKQCGFIKGKPGLTVLIAAFGDMSLPMDKRRAVLATSLTSPRLFTWSAIVSL